MKKKVIVAAGGSGGHIYPALAIAEKLQEMDSNLEVHFVGTPKGLENKLVPRENFPLHHIPIGRLNSNAKWSERLITLLSLPWALFKSFLLVRKMKPLFVLGVGGFATGPIVLVAALLRIRSYIWEPNAYPGLANRLLSRFVTEGLLLFKESINNMNLKKYRLVGYPIRKALEVPQIHTGDSSFRILIFGGSQGARGINNAVMDALEAGGDWLTDTKITHQTGSVDFHKVRSRYEKINNNQFEVREYLHDMPEQYSRANLVICRSGAGTLAELAACGKTGILIPLPWAADDHQKKNAQVLVKAGAACMLEQSELSEGVLAELVTQLKNDRSRLTQMEKLIKQFHKENASFEISKILIGAPEEDFK